MQGVAIRRQYEACRQYEDWSLVQAPWGSAANPYSPMQTWFVPSRHVSCGLLWLMCTNAQRKLRCLPSCLVKDDRQLLACVVCLAVSCA
jgi:hypothetical protein